MSSAAVPYSWDEGRWRGQIRSPAGGEAMLLGGAAPVVAYFRASASGAE